MLKLLFYLNGLWLFLFLLNWFIFHNIILVTILYLICFFLFTLNSLFWFLSFNLLICFLLIFRNFLFNLLRRLLLNFLVLILSFHFPIFRNGRWLDGWQVNHLVILNDIELLIQIWWILEVSLWKIWKPNFILLI